MFSHAFHKLCLVMVLCFLGSQSTFAQSPNASQVSIDTIKYIIVKNDSNEYVGFILSNDDQKIALKTNSLGVIMIQKSEIKSIEPYDEATDLLKPKMNHAGVFTTRYQFSTNCFPIKKGENYSLIHLYGPEIHYAVHRDFSIGVMSSWIASPLALALKYTRGTANPKINYGVGALFGTLGPITSFKGYGGLYWGMLTYGDRSNNITFSVGYGHTDDRAPITGSTDIKEAGIYPVVSGQYPNIPVQEVIATGGNTAFTAPIIGIAGRTNISEKMSFIFDGMFVFATDHSTYVEGTQTIVPHYGYSNGIYQMQEIHVSSWSYYSNGPGTDDQIFVLMPGVRWARSKKSNFQASIIGVLSKEYKIVFPMASWFLKI